MAEVTKEETLKKIEELVSEMKDKALNTYFFVIDTKGSPDGSVQYTYDIAYGLYTLGYKVTMVHQEEEFEGPFAWLGEKYKELQHERIDNKQLIVSPVDFFFCCDAFASILPQVKNLPCKKILLYNNPDYFIQSIPIAASLDDLKVNAVIASTDKLAEQMVSYHFKGVGVGVVRQAIKPKFMPSDSTRKLLINILASDPNDVSKIVKPFFWKYPAYKWISFRDLSHVTQDLFADSLKESAISIWINDDTNNAQQLLEARVAGNVVIAKVPDKVPSILTEVNQETGNVELRNDIIWFTDMDEIYNVIASVVRAWTKDEIVERFVEPAPIVNSLTAQMEDIKRTIVENIFDARQKELELVLSKEKTE